MYTCNECGKKFDKKQALLGHCSSHRRGDEYAKKRETENSKKAKEKKLLPKKCNFCNIEFKDGFSLGGHISNCKLNPNFSKKIEKISASLIGKKLPEDQKKRISEAMKVAHGENRAWNIGKSRWDNKKSYPEIFFSNVIQNEFIDKNYKSEYPVGIYSIDFAWPDLKKAIEIDGEQHERFDDYRQRDERKDEFLSEIGWRVLRITWKEMFNNTKEKIREAYNFIHE